MGKFFAGLLVGVVGLIACVLFILPAALPPLPPPPSRCPLRSSLAHMALDARVSKEAPNKVPIEANEANYIAGAHAYLDNCAVCHGAPGKQPTAISRGEFPHPPKLLEGKGVTDDPAGETYWKIANGIRLTGMPGFKDSLSETQMWQMALLLANADKVTPAVTSVLMGQSDVPPPVAVPVLTVPPPGTK